MWGITSVRYKVCSRITRLNTAGWNALPWDFTTLTGLQNGTAAGAAGPILPASAAAGAASPVRQTSAAAGGVGPVRQTSAAVGPVLLASATVGAVGLEQPPGDALDAVGPPEDRLAEQVAADAGRADHLVGPHPS